MDTKASDISDPAAELHPARSEAVACVQVVACPDPARIGARVALTHEPLLVGRELQGRGLYLSDFRLSRVHARLSFDALTGGYLLGDAQSRNGTFVNTRPIDSVRLSQGDVIRAGDTLLVFDERDPARRAREQADAVEAPLRARKTEVIVLAQRFARELGWELALHADAAEALLCWRWPFDLRELQSLIRACHAQSGDGALGVDRLHEAFPEIVRPLIERRFRGRAFSVPPARPWRED